MNDRFDEPTKEMAQSVTRRGALKKLGVGFAGIALAYFSLLASETARAPASWSAPLPLWRSTMRTELCLT